MEYGLYIHLPYCRSICPYCDFVKAPLHRAEPERLLTALARERELSRAGDESGLSRPRTVYVGGGTPTALPAAALAKFLAWVGEAWDLARVREFTVEGNPEGLDEEKLVTLYQGGVTRLSLGVQSLEPAALKALGRIHTGETALAALALAGRVGFRNVSVDLMYGVPGETAAGFREALDRFVTLGVPHLSAYPLQLEEGTPLHAKEARGAVRVPGEEEVLARYEDLVSTLAAAGYRHYEVSNFALPGYRSRHNEGYWTRRPYIGIGPGAHSFDGRARWSNDESIARWFTRVESGELPREGLREISAREASEEEIFLGLRRSRGLRSSRHLARFRPSVVEAWNEWGRAGEALTLLPRGRVRPTDRGLFLAHDLASELFARTDRLTPAAHG